MAFEKNIAVLVLENLNLLRCLENKSSPLSIFLSCIDQGDEMETEDFEEDEANKGEAEDESLGENDEDMDAKEDEEKEQIADEQSREGMEGNEKQDEGESPKVGGYQFLSFTGYADSKYFETIIFITLPPKPPHTRSS